MNTTRSAQAAADGSWVTITSVRPPLSTVPRSSASTSAGAQVERARRLVGEHELGLADERPGDRHALLLPAGQLRGRWPRGPRARRRRARRAPRRGQPAAGEPRGQRDVLRGGQRREQVEGLEDEADALAAQPGQRPLAERARARRRRGARCPEVGRSSPAADCSSVDLPEPDGPITAVNVPRAKSSVTPSSARTTPSPEPKSRTRDLGGWRASHGHPTVPVHGTAVLGRRGDLRFAIATPRPTAIPPTTGADGDMEAMPRTVLVVDDSAAFRTTRADAAGGARLRGRRRRRGRRVRRSRRPRGCGPDCVLLDVNLPDGDGVTVAGQLPAAGYAPASCSSPRSRRPRSATPSSVPARAASCRSPSSPRRASSNCWARRDARRHRRGPGAAAPGHRAAARRRRLRGRGRGGRRARPAAQGRRAQAGRRDRRRPDAARQHRRRPARRDGDPRDPARASACSCSPSTPRSATRST